ncbi:unnamed protein product (macronuclear) [Paramecium tetraurelia]|uniref:protein-tyrosine-phosphatase n=1 Tax=Paramecium tetraurelia TaxID=5888 RepID=A0DSW7_PARTE|nr:uncharacterized protein GSPATT00019827001 [Paramecium tetraurelia]CAK86134.1 unnamed protein product [Paramecium tetraurelia]|eukprot:XP_001453531.1 hypothetical protein (macronuclear) [Paramecium tetraurelia strain d4-2]
MKGFHLLKYTLPGEQPISLILSEKERGKLFLGNLDCLHNQQILEVHNINSILSICTEEKILMGPKYQQVYLDIHDNMNSQISNVFEKSYLFIENALKSQQNVLVHCAAGISRSATLVLAYLMKSYQYTLEQALRYLKQKRPYVRPNPGFLLQLLDYETLLYGSITSNLGPELTPFDVQRDAQYKPQPKVELRKSLPLKQIPGPSPAARVERKTHTEILTRVSQSLSTFQPKAFKS